MNIAIGHKKTSRLRDLSSILAIATTLVLLVPRITPPPPTGPYPVGTRILYLQDQTRSEDADPAPHRKRELIVQIWYPAEPSSKPHAAYERFADTNLVAKYRSLLPTHSRLDAPIANSASPFSVLLYNHAWADRSTNATYLTEDLASHGYVVAAIDHTYNAARVALPGGRIVEGQTGNPLDKTLHTADEIRNTLTAEQSKWVSDQVFVLNELAKANRDQSNPWYNRLDTDHAGAFGHSFGGGASIAVCAVDPRIRSAANMDGWSSGNILKRASQQPAMFLYQEGSHPHPENLTSSDRSAREGAELSVPDMAQVEDSLNQFGGYRLFVSHAAHMDFTDRSIVSPWHRSRDSDHIAPLRMQAIVRAYVLAFFDETLHGQKPPLLQSGNASPFQEVTFEVFTPKLKEGVTH